MGVGWYIVPRALLLCASVMLLPSWLLQGMHWVRVCLLAFGQGDWAARLGVAATALERTGVAMRDLEYSWEMLEGLLMILFLTPIGFVMLPVACVLVMARGMQKGILVPNDPGPY